MSSQYEKFDNGLENKNSDWAIVTYLESMGKEEVNSKGEIMLRNRNSFAGQLDLVSSSELNSLLTNFPDKVKGNIIKYGDLENLATYCYDKLKDEYMQLGINDEYCNQKMNYLESNFYKNGKLRADHLTESSLSDLVSKVNDFQYDLRRLQNQELYKSNSPSK